MSEYALVSTVSLDVKHLIQEAADLSVITDGEDLKPFLERRLLCSEFIHASALQACQFDALTHTDLMSNSCLANLVFSGWYISPFGVGLQQILSGASADDDGRPLAFIDAELGYALRQAFSLYDDLSLMSIERVQVSRGDADSEGIPDIDDMLIYPNPGVDYTTRSNSEIARLLTSTLVPDYGLRPGSLERQLIAEGLVHYGIWDRDGTLYEGTVCAYDTVEGLIYTPDDYFSHRLGLKDFETGDSVIS